MTVMIPDEPKPDHIHDPYNHNNLNLKLTMTQTSFTRKGQILAGQHLQLFQSLNIPFLFLFHQLLFIPNKVIRSDQTSGCNWGSPRKRNTQTSLFGHCPQQICRHISVVFATLCLAGIQMNYIALRYLILYYQTLHLIFMIIYIG